MNRFHKILWHLSKAVNSICDLISMITSIYVESTSTYCIGNSKVCDVRNYFSFPPTLCTINCSTIFLCAKTKEVKKEKNSPKVLIISLALIMCCDKFEVCRKTSTYFDVVMSIKIIFLSPIQSRNWSENERDAGKDAEAIEKNNPRITKTWQ